jgi:hypothetical protein
MTADRVRHKPQSVNIQPSYCADNGGLNIPLARLRRIVDDILGSEQGGMSRSGHGRLGRWGKASPNRKRVVRLGGIFNKTIREMEK